MASPIILYIIPNCGLNINVNISEYTENNSKPIGYTIINDDDELSLLPGTNAVFSGTMSPIHTITLPRAIKRGAGVPEEAAFYAFLHPPTNLATAINWSEWEKNNMKNFRNLITELKDDDIGLNDWAMPIVSLIGAYVYFDEALNVLSVNVVSLRPTKYDLRLSGPFEATELASSNIRRAGRAQPLLMDHFHEAGFVASACIRPHETFHLESPLKALGQEVKQCRHGGFLFFRDDGSSVMYVIENSGYIEYEGEVSSLADAFQQKQKSITTYSNLGFSANYKTIDEIVSTRNDIHRTFLSAKQKKRYKANLDDEKTLLHKAIQSDCKKEVIEFLLEEEVDNLLHQDSPYGWTPLFYACRFKMSEHSLILKMIEKCPEAVSIRDKYNRTALHVACENDYVSADIIRALLKADKDGKAFYQQTKYLKQLPIHILCYSNSTHDVLKCLLEYDEDGHSLSQKTTAGRLPLHMAVEKKLSPEIINSLLELNLWDRYDRHASNGSIEVSLDDKRFSRTLYQLFDGLLPLHIACLNNSPPETIKILLDADYRNTTVFEEIDTSSWNLCDKEEMLPSNILQPLKSRKSLFKETDTHTGEDDVDDKGTVALHLAAKHGDKDIIDLLLQKEKMNPRIISTVELQDIEGRCPLHIACKSKKANPAVVQQLLEADFLKGTIHVNDDYNYKAIHYTCDRHDANEEILKLLIKAEEKYFALGSDECQKKYKKRMTQTCDDRNRSPLYLAVQSEAKDQVLEMLLQPEHFFLKGFDHRLVSGLANRSVKSSRLQDLIMEKMTERCFFNLLFFDVYANACALWFFLKGSERMLAGSSRLFDPLMLISCLAIFIFRTTIQIKSQPSQFFADLWNWCQVLYIVLLARSVQTMMDNIGIQSPPSNSPSFSSSNNTYAGEDESNGSDKNLLLTFTFAFLIAQFTFFLKATFLPFARFVGGLLTIFNTLIPFFIVSGLLLLAFTYGFRMSGDQKENCPSLLECYFWTLQNFFSGTDETSDVLDVLFGIIAIVVLLNVLIAIVSEGWNTAAEKAVNLFWSFRLQFLSEARFLSELEIFFVDKIGNVRLFTDIIDNMSDVKLVDSTRWTKMPYVLVKRKKQYDKPHDYFAKEDADKILQAHSLQADLYWANSDSRRKQRSQAKSNIVVFVTVLKWSFNCLLYIVLIALGFCTAGWTWPKNFRLHLLAVGLRRNNNEEMKLKI